MVIRKLAAAWALAAVLGFAPPLLAQEAPPDGVPGPGGDAPTLPDTVPAPDGPAPDGGPTPPDPTPAPPDSVPGSPTDPGDPADAGAAPPEAAPDTLAAEGDAAADSLALDPDAVLATVREPPPTFIRFPSVGDDGWVEGTWTWTRDELLGGGFLTLTELLERIPGVTPVRSAILGQPEAVSAFGLAGGRVEVVLDGFVLDPLGSGTYDLGSIELVQLEEVRVERRMDRLRIELRTLAPTDARAYSIVEAGTGHYRTNMFRGLFLLPRFLGGALSFGIERLESHGGFQPAPTSLTAAWAKWGIGSRARNLQLEVRRTSSERGSATPSPGEGSRLDWVLRARAEPIPALAAEAYVGQTRLDEAYALPALPGGAPAEGDEIRDPLGREPSTWQAGLRAHAAAGPLWARAGVRHRTHAWLPEIEAEGSAGIDLAGWIFAAGEVREERWRELGAARSVGARVYTRPFVGLRAFAEWSSGARGASPGRDVLFPVDTLITPIEEDPEAPGGPTEDTTVVWAAKGPWLVDRTAWRAGAAFERWGLRLGAAAVVLEGDSVASFGLEFDRSLAAFHVGRARGFEVSARIPLLLDPLWVEASYTRWNEVSGWLYLPAQTFRASLVYHHLPLPSGNLEITARLDHVERGEMIVPSLDGGAAIVPPTRTLNGYLQIRIMDVRAFVRWDNILNAVGNADVPGRILPGQRIFYGVKWNFWD